MVEEALRALGVVLKAMVAARKEAGFFAMLQAGVKTWFLGDDMHRNDKTLITQTEELLRLQNALDKAKAGGAPESDLSVQRYRLQIKGIEDLLKVTMTTRKVLTGSAGSRRQER